MLNAQTKVLVTGCGGMLGEAIYPYFKDICLLYPTDIDLNEPWLSYLDVTDSEKVKEMVNKIKPDYIFHLAALTDMEYCESNHLHAYNVNAQGTENIALLCRKMKISMVYITTAGTFGGTQEEYTDYDIPKPLSVYAKSKYAGESFIKENLSKYFIFRPGWMIGGGPKKDKKFVNKIIKQLRAGKKELHVVDDKFGSPTYTYDFAKIIHEVIKKCSYGLYNSVCEGSGSRYDVANEIIKIKNLKDVKLTKISSSHISSEYFAPRPKSECLVNIKLKLRGISIQRDWRDCLKEYLSKYDWGI